MLGWWNGRHASFRYWWFMPCGFKSHSEHQQSFTWGTTFFYALKKTMNHHSLYRIIPKNPNARKIRMRQITTLILHLNIQYITINGRNARKNIIDNNVPNIIITSFLLQYYFPESPQFLSTLALGSSTLQFSQVLLGIQKSLIHFAFPG